MRSRAIQDTRQLFLWSMGAIFLFAFTSIFIQIPGLYGPNGLLPVYNVVPTLKENQTLYEHSQSFYSFPSLLLYSNYFSLPPEYAMELACIVGIILSFCVIVFQSMRCSLVFLLIWLMYLTVHEVGQTFMYFQWDSLLLEAGIISVLVAPLNLTFWRKPIARPHDSSSFWLVRWLLFRLMFASGVVKLTSQCPTWWGLTALRWHYESQCIPTPFAWFAHQLPDWFQSLSVVGTYYIEILVPFFFFFPIRSIRLFAFLNQVFFQICIILTGNYNFFNLLTLALCVSLLDDAFLDSTPFWQKRKVPMDWSRRMLKSWCGKRSSFIHAFLRLVAFILIVGVSVGVAVHYFNLQVSGGKILSSVGFSMDEFNDFVRLFLPLSVLIGCASLFLELWHCLLDSLSKHGLFNKLWSVAQTVMMLASIIVMFMITLIPLSYLDDGSFHSLIPSEIKSVHTALQPLHFTSSYGLFRSMTGVGGRPELIIEGSNDENGPWREYDFLYKPWSSLQTTSTSCFNQSGPWWTRSFQKDYLFSLSLDHTGLQEYLQKNNMLNIPKSSCDVQYICSFIDQIRSYSRLLPPTEICLAMLTMATILQLTLAMMSNLGQARAADYKVKPLAPQPRQGQENGGKGALAKKDKSLSGNKEKGSGKKNKKNNNGGN
ncbi:PREDICTED: lipase maturation factor 2-like [Amphimedon queenslandica]|uniref:Lipase maturation factor n=1 Tax=Amphimedon queenslandica TaxID=400682 RepID=A0AAN0JIA5_AMPQE|nr:PREDICTED: lipase maturation factor 2-like [Amphimedon queenslandica]|eukprot:XP_019856704.1 PREDICTED: lipase maturation factor 2-like [Amphimedon queenslandica]